MQEKKSSKLSWTGQPLQWSMVWQHHFRNAILQQGKGSWLEMMGGWMNSPCTAQLCTILRQFTSGNSNKVDLFGYKVDNMEKWHNAASSVIFSRRSSQHEVVTVCLCVPSCPTFVLRITAPQCDQLSLCLWSFGPEWMHELLVSWRRRIRFSCHRSTEATVPDN